jgi:hypothetical protein
MADDRRARRLLSKAVNACLGARRLESWCIGVSLAGGMSTAGHGLNAEEPTSLRSLSKVASTYAVLRTLDSTLAVLDSEVLIDLERCQCRPTLRQLLCHTAGLVATEQVSTTPRLDGWRVSGMMSFAPPGSWYSYSDHAFALAMNNNHVAPQDVRRMVDLRTALPGGGAGKERYHGLDLTLSTGLEGSIRDLIKLGHMALRGPRQAFEPQAPADPVSVRTLAWYRTDVFGSSVFQHGGGGGGVPHIFLALVPAVELVVAVSTQGAGAENAKIEIADSVISETLGTRPERPSPCSCDDLSHYVGTYSSGVRVAKVSVQDEELVLEGALGASAQLTQCGQDAFAVNGSDLMPFAPRFALMFHRAGHSVVGFTYLDQFFWRSELG